eukprot:984806-Heterocapsa_arctica.AAC.1
MLTSAQSSRIAVHAVASVLVHISCALLSWAPPMGSFAPSFQNPTPSVCATSSCRVTMRPYYMRMAN